MVVAFAVLGIATLAIGGFFVSSSRSYASSSSETGLQYEAQMALNQIEGKLIDAALGVNYNLIDNSGNHFVENDTISDDSLTSKVLYIFDSDVSGYHVLLIKWDIANQELLYKEVSLSSSQTNVADIDVSGTLASGTWQLMAEGVNDFSVDLTKYSETKAVDVTLGLEKKNREIEVVGTITLRNNVLINESDLAKIYQNVSNQKASVVHEVLLTANTNITVPGGQVQLSTKVTGVYPSQDIHGWIVAKACDDLSNNVVGDNSNHITDGKTFVTPETKILTISPDAQDLESTTFHETVYVQAYVNTVNASGEAQTIYSNIVAINVRDIKGFTVWPTADASLAANSSLFKNGTPSFPSLASGAATNTITTPNIHAGNIIKMNYSVEGSSGSTNETYVVWSIDSKHVDVNASIDENGVITVDRNSKPGYLNVRATLQGTNYYVIYPLMVTSPYAANVDILTVTAPTEMYRGAEPEQCEVFLNGQDVYESDYNWFVSVRTASGQEVTGNPVEISSTGVLTVKDTLSFDYKYLITVVAVMKSDPNIQATAIVQVPKVNLVLTPATYRTNIGTKIQAGNIVCSVVGLVNYDIDWSIAKETNPSYYFTAYGNTNITGTDFEGEKSPVIVIGADEPSSLTYMRVKATLSGYSNYFATMRLNFTDDGTTENPPSTGGGTTNPPSTDDDDDDDNIPVIPTTTNYQIRTDANQTQRGSNVGLYVRRRNSGNNYNVDADWRIVSAYSNVNGQRVERSTSGLSLTEDYRTRKVTLNVDETYEWADGHYAQDIMVEIAATVNGTQIKDYATIRIVPVTLAISGDSTIGRNSEKVYSYSLSGLTQARYSQLTIRWSLQNSNGAALNSSRIELNRNTGTEVEVSTDDAQSGTEFKVCVTISSGNTTYMTASKDVEVTGGGNNSGWPGGGGWPGGDWWPWN